MCLTGTKLVLASIYPVLGVVGIVLCIYWRFRDTRGKLLPLDRARDALLIASTSMLILGIDPFHTRGIIPWQMGHILAFVEADFGIALLFYLTWMHVRVSTRVLPRDARRMRKWVKICLIVVAFIYYPAGWTFSVLHVFTRTQWYRDFRVLCVSFAMIISGIPETILLVKIRREVLRSIKTCPQATIVPRKAALQRLNRLAIAIVVLVLFASGHVATTIPAVDFSLKKDVSLETSCKFTAAADMAGILFAHVGWLVLLTTAVWKTTHKEADPRSRSRGMDSSSAVVSSEMVSNSTPGSPSARAKSPKAKRKSGSAAGQKSPRLGASGASTLPGRLPLVSAADRRKSLKSETADRETLARALSSHAASGGGGGARSVAGDVP